MNTITASTQSGLLSRLKSFFSAAVALLQVTAEATTAPTHVSNPLRLSLRDQFIDHQLSIGHFKENNMEVRDVDGDMHCSMDARSEMEWISNHTLPHGRPYEFVPKKLDELLRERRERTDYPVIGSFHLDTKRLRMDYNGGEHVVRKVEFITRRPDGQEPKNEHPEMSHEWHKYFLVFSEEGYIVDLVKGD